MYRIAVTNRHLCQNDFLTQVERLAKGKQYQTILLREKDLTEEEYEWLARDVLLICQKNNTKCILHSYPQTALRLKHSFLHMPLSLWERLSEEERRAVSVKMEEMGTSVHSLAQLRQAEEMGASYVIAGHIFETDCKKGLQPRGLSFLRSLCGQTDIPVYGIGGINEENEQSVIAAGASGVCIMSGCME